MGLCWKILLENKKHTFLKEVFIYAKQVCLESFTRFLVYKSWISINGFISHDELRIDRLTEANDCNQCGKEMEHFQIVNPEDIFYELCISCAEKDVKNCRLESHTNFERGPNDEGFRRTPAIVFKYNFCIYIYMCPFPFTLVTLLGELVRHSLVFNDIVINNNNNNGKFGRRFILKDKSKLKLILAYGRKL
jgi:hypothetical protein